MPDHRIKLRGGWELDPPASSRWITLPIAWNRESPDSFRLVRHFGRPNFDPSTESLRLDFADVGGLAAIELNGEIVARPIEGTSSFWVDLPGGLLPRNRLVLEVDPGRAEFGAGRVAWGLIALVISGRP